MPWWAAKPLADDRRRELADTFRASRIRAEARFADQPVAQPPQQVHRRSADVGSRPAEGGAVGRHLGTWLIRAGTRLGGATVRTS